MELKITDRERHRKEIEIKLPAGEVDGYFDGAVRRIASRANVPGFRKGKVPSHILELRLGKQLKVEVFDEMFKDAFRKAREENKLEPASYPEIDTGSELPERKKEFGFKIIVDVLPEISLGKYRGITLEKENVEVTEAMVDDVFKKEQEAYAGLVPVEGRPVRKDDRVAVEGERVDESGSRQAVPESVVPVGTGSLPPELEEGLLGALPGEEREIKVKQQEGNAHVYRLKVKGIQEKGRIIANDDSARAAGYSSREEWREDVKKRIHERIEQKTGRELSFAAIDAAVKAAEVDIPESLAAPRADYFRKVYEAMGKETGEPVDEAKVRELAERQVKENLVVNKIAEVENIVVDDEEVSARKSGIAGGGGDPAPDDDDIRYSLRREKVIDFILENADIKKKGKPLILKPGDVNLVSER